MVRRPRQPALFPYTTLFRSQRGERDDGSDSVAAPLAPAAHWPLRVLIAVTDEGPKPVGSTDGMTRTEFTSPYFDAWIGSEEHTSELQSRENLVCRLLLE